MIGISLKELSICIREYRATQCIDNKSVLHTIENICDKGCKLLNGLPVCSLVDTLT